MTMNEFVLMVEAEMQKCADINNAPFGLDAQESAAYLSGKASALQWVLEMLPIDNLR